MLIDCSKDDQITKALCLNFEDDKSFKKVNDENLKFSMFSGVSWNIALVILIMEYMWFVNSID